jgi:hypothetical protein
VRQELINPVVVEVEKLAPEGRLRIIVRDRLERDERLRVQVHDNGDVAPPDVRLVRADFLHVERLRGFRDQQRELRVIAAVAVRDHGGGDDVRLRPTTA